MLTFQYGYDVEDFVLKPCEDFFCGLCSKVLNNPRLCRKGDMFCLECITLFIQSSDECPICKCQISTDSLTECPFAWKQIGEMMIKCSCGEAISLKTSVEHREIHCTNALVDCPLFAVKCCDKKCNGKVKRADLNDHVLQMTGNMNAIMKILSKISIPTPIIGTGTDESNISLHADDEVIEKENVKSPAVNVINSVVAPQAAAAAAAAAIPTVKATDTSVSAASNTPFPSDSATTAHPCPHGDANSGTVSVDKTLVTTTTTTLKGILTSRIIPSNGHPKQLQDDVNRVPSTAASASTAAKDVMSDTASSPVSHARRSYDDCRTPYPRRIVVPMSEESERMMIEALREHCEIGPEQPRRSRKRARGATAAKSTAAESEPTKNDKMPPAGDGTSFEDPAASSSATTAAEAVHIDVVAPEVVRADVVTFDVVNADVVEVAKTEAHGAAAARETTTTVLIASEKRTTRSTASAAQK